MLVVAGGEEHVLPAGVHLGPSYIRSVIDEQVSRNHRLIPCQNDLLQKLRAKVLLHPGILLVRAITILLDRACADEHVSAAKRERRTVSLGGQSLPP